MRQILAFILITLFAIPVYAADAPKADTDKTLYAVGLVVARQLSVFALTPDELEIVNRGIADATTGKKPEVDVAAYGVKIQELARARRKMQGEKAAAGDKEFMEKVAREKGALKTDSGLIFITEKEGTGAHPSATDKVTVNYRGTLPDGKEFDSSYKRGKPFEFKMDGVIKCWTEGIQKMKVGGKARLICPPSIAYGDAGAGEMILPGATLEFDVELLGAKAAEEKKISPEQGK